MYYVITYKMMGKNETYKMEASVSEIDELLETFNRNNVQIEKIIEMEE